MKQEPIFAPGLFTGKSVIITGGGTGIGLAIAKFLGELGAHVILVSRTKATLEKAVAELKAESIHANYVPINIRKLEEVTELFETVSNKWGAHDILVNAVAPGTIATNGLEQYEEEHVQKSIQRLPVNRLGKPEEVASAVVYLLSEAGNYITGTTLEIDGGEHLLGASDQD